MGGGSGSRMRESDLRRLEEEAKKKLERAKGSGASHAFISFDHDDVDDVNLLRGQAKNDNVEFEFDDYSVKEPIDSKNADYIKRQIAKRIEQCSITLVYLTPRSAASAWVNWEIEETLRQGKHVIGVYQGDAPPSQLPPAFARTGQKPVRWEHEALRRAIEAAKREKE